MNLDYNLNGGWVVREVMEMRFKKGRQGSHHIGLAGLSKKVQFYLSAIGSH